MFTHVDEKNFPNMVDVSEKKETVRTAVATGFLNVPASLFENFDGTDLHSKKGPVFSTAIVAATMAVKRTSDIIPFCHPIPIEGCKIEIRFCTPTSIEIMVEVKTTGKTGIEMEALTGVQVAALTLYDMCKSWTHELEITNVRLVKKTGGKSDYDKN
jgi:cyclic pyranopterin phosphate synthase